MSTPLHKACAGNKPGHLSAVKQLLKGAADVHALNKWRETPLLTAANHGQAAAVEALLDSGADPCRCTDTGWSPLSIAAYKGHDDVVELLLEKDAPTEEADPTLSALLQAATKGLPNTVELLLRHGADHTVTTKKGDTALSILVEQNLIDAAVEMVTEYKASVPRCSRDRKKVQRARLLINLRIKQQKEGGEYSKYDDDSDQDDSDEGSGSALALHDSTGSPNGSTGSKKKKKKKGKNSLGLEQKAKAAEEALLLELEQEDAKAQKEEATATSKRNKKKKKKDRDRQQKLEQETLRKEKEEKETLERDNQRRVKEEKERKVRDAKAKEQRELEMKEAGERQKKAAARQKENEEKEKKRLGQEKREQEKREKERQDREQRDAEKLEQDRLDGEKLAKERAAQQKALAKKQEVNSSTSQTTSKRGWETPNVGGTAESNSSNESSLPLQTGNGVVKVTVEDQLENMANGVVGFLGFDSVSNNAANDTPGSMVTDVSTETMDQTVPVTKPQQHVEPAPLSLFRQDKVSELLRRSSSEHPLASIGSHVVQTVLYKWIVRASYNSVPFLDPLIPSWTDKDMLVGFLQRQFILESVVNGIAPNIEMMKEAGSVFADLCTSLANEVVKYRKQFVEAYPNDFSDLTLSMTASEIVATNGSRVVAIDWNGRSKVYVPTAAFQHIRSRYIGPSKSLLSSVFALVKRYETMRMILHKTELDCHLSASTLTALARELKVRTELWANPLSVFDNNHFCGLFADIDTLFGGFSPFIEQNNAVQMFLEKEGGSVALLPSLDSTTASRFTQRVVNILEATEGKGVPVSFVIFLPMQAFGNLSTSPVAEDLELLDPRLLQPRQTFIRHFELLRPGQHSFQHGDAAGESKTKTCNTGSIMLILQNDSGRAHFPVNEQSITNIVRSMSVNNFMSGNDCVGSSAPAPTFQSFGAANVSNSNSIPSSPIAAQQSLSSFDAVGDIGNARSNNGARRGRFFDLVDDGDDDFANAEAMVSGMLSSLDISMFQDNTSEEVDIEAISLMGFGNPNDVNSSRQTGRFG